MNCGYSSSANDWNQRLESEVLVFFWQSQYVVAAGYLTTSVYPDARVYQRVSWSVYYTYFDDYHYPIIIIFIDYLMIIMQCTQTEDNYS